MYACASPSGHLLRKEKNKMNFCLTAAPSRSSVELSPPALCFLQMMNFTVLHMETSPLPFAYLLPVLCDLDPRTRGSSCYPAVCFVGFLLLPPLYYSVVLVSRSPGCRCHPSCLRVPLYQGYWDGRGSWMVVKVALVVRKPLELGQARPAVAMTLRIKFRGILFGK